MNNAQEYLKSLWRKFFLIGNLQNMEKGSSNSFAAMDS
jgi:hypothetical protein